VVFHSAQAGCLAQGPAISGGPHLCETPCDHRRLPFRFISLQKLRNNFPLDFGQVGLSNPCGRSTAIHCQLSLFEQNGGPMCFLMIAATTTKQTATSF
jgi:hypothetical protein